MFKARICQYSPLWAASFERKLSIVQETKNCDFVCLIGAGQKQLEDNYDKEHIDKQLYVQSGFTSANGSNKSCGVGIICSRKYSGTKTSLGHGPAPDLLQEEALQFVQRMGELNSQSLLFISPQADEEKSTR